MKDNLVVSVLGNRNSGKSHTWNKLFGREVRTGKELKRLYFNKTEYVLVFLISGSPEERHKYVGDLITVKQPEIVLCSMQYIEGVKSTIDYFSSNNYFMYVHWLNPGYSDPSRNNDDIGIVRDIRQKSCIVEERSGKDNANARVDEMKVYIYGWASSQNLIIKD